MIKRMMLVFVAVLFAAPLFASSVAFGEPGTGDTSATPSATPNTTSAEAETEAPETEVQKTERDARVKKLKEVQKTKLASAEKKKIQGKCQASQGKMSSITGRFKGIETSRTQVHDNLVTRLNSLNEKLKAKGVVTVELEAGIAVLNTKIATFNTDLAAYKQSVTDLKALDCKTDPEGFKATLTTARTNLETVRADAKAVHTYLNETIKPLLKTLRDKVEETTENNTETNDSQGGNQ